MRPSQVLLGWAFIALGGCAHLLTPRPAWHCSERIEEAGLNASTVRTLDSRGRQIRIRSQWLKPYALNPDSMILAEWSGTSAGTDRGAGRVTVGVAPREGRAARVEIRKSSPARPATDETLVRPLAQGGLPHLTVPWPLFDQMLAGGEPLFLVALDQRGSVHRSERVDRMLFARGLAMVGRTERASGLKLPVFRTACQLHQEIILT